ncbi:hypothetical protein L7F22_006083, partial [Adiantum nelumboides]|nr:hypothetical protein [Adiantum nelumboides]
VEARETGGGQALSVSRGGSVYFEGSARVARPVFLDEESLEEGEGAVPWECQDAAQK